MFKSLWLTLNNLIKYVNPLDVIIIIIIIIIMIIIIIIIIIIVNNFLEVVDSF